MMVEIGEELFNPAQGQAVPQQVESISSAGDALSSLASSPLEDFMATLTQLTESKGIDLDTVMSGEGSVEDEADLAGEANPLELFSREEITMLVDKFLAISPEEQSSIMQALDETLPPKAMNMIKAAIRLGQQDGVGEL
jgi:hypothetical protein